MLSAAKLQIHLNGERPEGIPEKMEGLYWKKWRLTLKNGTNRLSPGGDTGGGACFERQLVLFPIQWYD